VALFMVSTSLGPGRKGHARPEVDGSYNGSADEVSWGYQRRAV